MKQEHYDKLEIEPIDYIEANGLTFSEGNVVKYISRHRHKNGKEDVLKAIDYCKRILDVDYGDNIGVIDEPEGEEGYTAYDAVQFARLFRDPVDAFTAIKKSILLETCVKGAFVTGRENGDKVLTLSFHNGTSLEIRYSL